MEIIFLALIFAVILLMLALHRPLWQAVTASLVLTVLLYRIPLGAAAGQVGGIFTRWSNLSVLVALYLIQLLQRVLNARDLVRLAQRDLDSLFHDRRVTVIGSCLFIGLFPSAASMLLCSEIVRDSGGKYLSPVEQAFTTSWFRHIPESTLPTYTAVLLMLTMSGVSFPLFLLAMVPPVIMLAAIGFAFALRKLPAGVEGEGAPFRRGAVVGLLSHIWPLALVLGLILVCGLSVVTAVLVSIAACVLVYRIGLGEGAGLLAAAFDKKILGNTFLVLALRELLGYTGVLERLPEAMAGLPLPPFAVFALLVMATTIIASSTTGISMCTPLAFAVLPGGVPLAVYLMCVSHAASQISPVHVCLVVASEAFGVPLGALIRKTIPPVVCFVAFATLYYLLLSAVL